MEFGNIFAYYDPRTKKIVNCKKGTFVYYHELRHFQQDNENLFSRILAFLFTTWKIVTLIAGIITLLTENKFYLLLSFFYPLFALWFSEFYIEIDAWIYAIKKYMELN